MHRRAGADLPKAAREHIQNNPCRIEPDGTKKNAQERQAWYEEQAQALLAQGVQGVTREGLQQYGDRRRARQKRASLGDGQEAAPNDGGLQQGEPDAAPLLGADAGGAGKAAAPVAPHAKDAAAAAANAGDAALASQLHAAAPAASGDCGAGLFSGGTPSAAAPPFSAPPSASGGPTGPSGTPPPAAGAGAGAGAGGGAAGGSTIPPVCPDEVAAYNTAGQVVHLLEKWEDVTRAGGDGDTIAVILKKHQDSFQAAEPFKELYNANKKVLKALIKERCDQARERCAGAHAARAQLALIRARAVRQVVAKLEEKGYLSTNRQGVKPTWKYKLTGARSPAPALPCLRNSCVARPRY